MYCIEKENLLSLFGHVMCTSSCERIWFDWKFHRKDKFDFGSIGRSLSKVMFEFGRLEEVHRSYKKKEVYHTEETLK